MKNNNKITESSNILSEDIDTKNIEEILYIFNKEDAKVVKAVNDSIFDIKELIELTIVRLKNKGRLFYVGAGTSGRLGVIDAAECKPTFGVDDGIIQGIIAGGDIAMTRSVENAEDEIKGIKIILRNHSINSNDIIIGISCSGSASFVLEFLKESKSIGAVTSLITFNDIQDISYIDKILRVFVGPEIISGSTRMKSGTATKMILNMISTVTMIKLNKTYGNIMVDLRIMNKKLFNRGINIISSITGINSNEAKKLLKKSNGYVKNAIIMHKLNFTFKKSEILLKQYNGSLKNLLNAFNKQ